MTDVRTELRRASRRIDVPDGSFEHLVERRERGRRRGQIVSFVVAVVVAAGLVGGGMFLLNGIDVEPKDAGTSWAPSRRLVLRPGEYFYLRVTSDEEEDGWVRDVETWWAADGSGEVRNRSTRQDKYPHPPSGTYGEGEFPEPYDVSSLLDPDVLAARLGDGTFDGATVLLIETPYSTPKLRAEVFEVVSGLDGVKVIEDVLDPAGRPAIALETSEHDGEDTGTGRMYFDPGTHQVMAWTFESTRGGSAWILLESAIVGAPGKLPEQDEWLVPPVEEAPA